MIADSHAVYYILQPVVRWHFSDGGKSKGLLETLSSGPTVLLFTQFDACSQHNKDVSLVSRSINQYLLVPRNVDSINCKQWLSYYGVFVLVTRGSSDSHLL